jgi:hypothetical protein
MSENTNWMRHFISSSGHFCGLVIRVPGYRSRGLSSIPGATRFSEKWWVWNGVVSTIKDLFERKSSGSGPENREYGHRDPSRWPRDTLYPQIWHKLRRWAAIARSVQSAGGLKPRSHCVIFILSTETYNWDIMPCRLEKANLKFREAYRLHLQGHW